MADCNKQLQAEGHSYPRTCARCKLGPCTNFTFLERQTEFESADGFWWAVVDGETIVVECANGSWFKIGTKIPTPQHANT